MELRSKGDVADHIEFMAALLPDKLPAELKSLTFDVVFEQLGQGLDMIRRRLGDDNLAACKALAAEAKRNYVVGRPDEAFDRLYEILGVIEGKRYSRIGGARSG